MIITLPFFPRKGHCQLERSIPVNVTVCQSISLEESYSPTYNSSESLSPSENCITIRNSMLVTDEELVFTTGYMPPDNDQLLPFFFWFGGHLKGWNFPSP